MKKIIQNFLLSISSLIVLFLIINFIIFFSSKSISQKYISKKIISFFPVESTYYYADIYNSLETYDLILGDSHAFGSGQSWYNDEYEYSIGHHLYNLTNKKINFINVGFPGAGAEVIYKNFLNSQKKINKKPEKIIYLFYEGNDLENNILYEEFKNKGKIKKNSRYYFPVLHILKRLYNFLYIQLYKLKKRLFNSNEKDISSMSKDKQNFNQFKLNDELIKYGVKLQSPPIELSDKNLSLALKILFKTLNKIKNENNNLFVVYVPSPTTVLNLKNPIYFQKYFKNDTQLTSTKQELEYLSEYIRNEIKNFSKKNNVIFIDTTEQLKNLAHSSEIYGPNDFKHPNEKGYKIISKVIYKNIYK